MITFRTALAWTFGVATTMGLLYGCGADSESQKDPPVQDASAEAEGAAGSGGSGPDASPDATEGGSDPCDAPEICDGLDNDCDGVADEGLWTAGSKTEVGTGSPKFFAPAITRRSDGSFLLAASDDLLLNVWDLASNFSTQAGPKSLDDVDPYDEQHHQLPRIATNGSSLAVGAYIRGAGDCAHLDITLLSIGAAVASLPNWTILNTTGHQCPEPVFPATWWSSNPDVAFDGTNYVVAWSDASDLAMHVYFAQASPAGVVQPGVLAGGSAAASVTSAPRYPDSLVHVESSGGNTVVGWTSSSTGGARPRFVRLDSTSSSVELGPIDLTGAAAGHVLRDMAINGSVLGLLTAKADGETIVHAVDVKTGTFIASQPFPGTFTDRFEPHIEAVGSGFMVTRLNKGTPLVIGVGWAPAKLDLPVTSLDVAAGTAATSATVAAVDAKNAVLTYAADGKVQVVPLVCKDPELL